MGRLLAAAGAALTALAALTRLTGAPAAGTPPVMSGPKVAAPAPASAPAVATAVQAAGFYGSGAGSVSQKVIGMAVTADDRGYWLAGAGGEVRSFGDAVFHGAAAAPSAPIVAIMADQATGGYWLVGADGNVYARHAPAFGSRSGHHLAAPVVAGAATADDKGYWLVGSDGSVYAFGDAAFAGSVSGVHLDGPVVGIAPDRATGGYWLIGSDGAVFAFKAPFFGSAGGVPLAHPIVGGAPTPSGAGYWLVGADGSILTYGDASFYGSTQGLHLNRPVLGLVSGSRAAGYWLAAGDGGVFAFAPPTNRTSVPQAQASLNWSGYNDISAAPSAFTSVTGSWQVPAVTCTSTQTAMAAAWDGLDGAYPSGQRVPTSLLTVEQAGTTSGCWSGRAAYGAWFEMYPALPVELNPGSYPLQPGDAMTGTVTSSDGRTFFLTLADRTRSWQFTTTQKSPVQVLRQSAEWIVEDPANGPTQVPVPRFTPVTFTGATVTARTGGPQPVNGVAGSYAVNMVSVTPGLTKSVASALSPAGTAFTVTWEHS